jgi:hypothetical protein
MAKKRDFAEAKVRMSKSLYSRIQREADKRSLPANAEIVRRLESSFQADRMFEGVLAPHNAKLVRMVGQAAIMAGDWRDNKIRFDALETAVTYALYAAALELLKREREEFDKTKPTRAQIRADESDEMGSAIAQVVIANEMPQQSAREVMHEHAYEHMRRDERASIYWGREEKPLSKLRELENRLADKKERDKP